MGRSVLIENSKALPKVVDCFRAVLPRYFLAAPVEFLSGVLRNQEFADGNARSEVRSGIRLSRKFDNNGKYTWQHVDLKVVLFVSRVIHSDCEMTCFRHGKTETAFRVRVLPIDGRLRLQELD